MRYRRVTRRIGAYLTYWRGPVEPGASCRPLVSWAPITALQALRIRGRNPIRRVYRKDASDAGATRRIRRAILRQSCVTSTAFNAPALTLRTWRADAQPGRTGATARRVPALCRPRRRTPPVLGRPGDPRHTARHALDVVGLPGVLAVGVARPGQLHRPGDPAGQPGRPVVVHPRRDVRARARRHTGVGRAAARARGRAVRRRARRRLPCLGQRSAALDRP